MRLTALFRSFFACGAFAAALLEAAPARYPTYEPDSAKAPAATKNLFLNAKTSAKDQWSDRAPALAVNGKNDAGNHWASDSLPAWHMIDLEKAQPLSSIRIVPYWPDGRIYQFYIESSTDGSTWTMLSDQRANSINAGASGFTFSFDPVQARYIRTTFTNNTANKAGHIVAIEGYAVKRDASSITLLPGQRWERYDRDQPANLSAAPATIDLRGWKGERVNAIAVAQSPEGFKELIVEPCELTGPKGEKVPVQVDIIRYTLADGTLTADILDGTSQTGFKGVTRPLFLTVDIPANAPATAKGALTLRINGNTRTLPITLKTDNLTLPPPAQWNCHIDIWQHPDAVARWHDVPLWSPEHFALLKPYMQRLAGLGQKAITTTLIDEAWGHQTYDHFKSMIGWVKKTDGSWRYDYSRFDAWVSFMINEVGIKQQISCYSMLPWSLTFSYYDEAQGRTISPRLQPGSPEYEAFWGSFLKDFTAHLKEKGWLKITKIAMDERPDNQVKPALKVVAKYAPELEIVQACNGPSAINEAFYDVSYSFNIAERVTPLAEQRRKEGKKTTVYICVSPRRPNTFLISNLAESEWVPVMAARYGLDGILRWAYQSWVENPLVSTDFTSWPTGDTALVYPGNRSSMRLEYLRDGIETLEKINILRKRADAKTLEPLNKALEVFTVKRGGQQGVHADDLRPVEEAMHRVTEALSR